jgi:uncharacterized protein YkwD
LKVTRLFGVAWWIAAAAAGACAAAAGDREAAPLRVRAPLLKPPFFESYPGPARPKDPVQSTIFERINADRAAAGLPPVAWDERTARVATAFCAAQIRERTRGHFLTDGLPPYARTALAGSFGMQAENSSTWLTSARSFQRSTVDLALAAHADMMGERPPADGHRRTILDPEATHVGVGWAQEQGNFRMAQEFMTRRLVHLTLSAVAEGRNVILLEGKVLTPGRLEFVTLAREPVPRALTKAEANSRTSYTYPAPRLAYVPEGKKSLRVVGAETQDRLRVGVGGEFSFRFAAPLPGLWTIVFYTAEARQEARPGGLAVVWVERGSAP